MKAQPHPLPVESLPPEAYARVFENSPDGAAVLEELVRRFARPHVRTGGIDGIRESDFRAGQRSVTEFIVGRINTSTGYPDPPTEET
jgi:hypothetical protein